MICRNCRRQISRFRQNPGRGRVEPWCAACNLWSQPAPDFLLRVCPGCGVDFATVRFAERLGCDTCYDTFRDELLLMMEQAGIRSKTTLFEHRPATDVAMAHHHQRTEYLQKVCGRPPALPKSLPVDTANDALITPKDDTMMARIRVARNFAGLRYLTCLDDDTSFWLSKYLLADDQPLIRFFAGHQIQFQSGTTSPADLRRKVSTQGDVEILTSDEDHLRLCFYRMIDRTSADDIVSQIQLFSAKIDSLVSDLDRFFFFQSRLHFGFLTACPSNSGSGRRLSFRFALDDPSKFLADAVGRRFLIRGSSGEGSSLQDSLTVVAKENSDLGWLAHKFEVGFI